MQGSREVVGMNRPGAIRRLVARDTFLARQSFVRALGHALEERRVKDREEDTAHTVAIAKVVRTEIEAASASAFSESMAINS